ncbi:SDR family NAD(P)-dependent oxidoreductase [Bacillus sp. FSL R5-0811]|uniref:SDR family NAD(P)-dependent oxidoreductase n=1 Tax=unclassified Bacillus (in: firmicutes) TaxID=185979 RepID=UPI0030FCE7BA
MKKVVVITGASDGIGYETAIYLASKGMIVVLSSRNKTKLESVRKKYILWAERLLLSLRIFLKQKRSSN